MEPCEARTAPNRFTEAVDSLKNCGSVCIIVHLSCFTWKLPWSQAFADFLSILVATRQRPVTIVVPDTNHRCHCRYCGHKSRVSWWPTAAADPIGSLTSYKKHLSTANASTMMLSTDAMRQHDKKNGKLWWKTEFSKSRIELATSETGQANSSALKSAADMCCCAFQVALKAGGSNLVDTAAGTWPIHSNNGRSYYFEIAYRTGVSTMLIPECLIGQIVKTWKQLQTIPNSILRPAAGDIWDSAWQLRWNGDDKADRQQKIAYGHGCESKIGYGSLRGDPYYGSCVLT